MTAQGNALGNKSATMTNALKGRNKMLLVRESVLAPTLAGILPATSQDWNPANSSCEIGISQGQAGGGVNRGRPGSAAILILLRYQFRTR